MLPKNSSRLSKILLQFYGKSVGGLKRSFVFEELNSDKFEKFIDFYIDYFAKHEVTHKVAGVHKSSEALKEYRQVLSKTYRDPQYKIALCSPENTDQIIGFTAVKLVNKGDPIDTDFLKDLKTYELKKFYEVLFKWNDMVPLDDIMSKYGVDKMYEDAGTAIHPDFQRHGIVAQVCLLRRKSCIENQVPMTGAWMTAIGTQKATAKDGWETIFEISRQELEKIIGVKFNADVPETFKYNLWRQRVYS